MSNPTLTSPVFFSIDNRDLWCRLNNIYNEVTKYNY